MKTFEVRYRNPGHWDINCWDGDRNYRKFRIRGGPGKVWVDHWGTIEPLKYFKTVSAAMAYITDELMFEHIVAEGQEPIIIEKFHIS